MEPGRSCKLCPRVLAVPAPIRFAKRSTRLYKAQKEAALRLPRYRETWLHAGIDKIE